MSNKARQKRNGELIALGIALEQGFGRLSSVAKQEIASLASGLDARNKARFTDAIERISKKDHGISEKENEDARTDNDPSKMLTLKIDYSEKDLRDQIKEAGGTWEAERKVWLLPPAQVEKLALQDRVI